MNKKIVTLATAALLATTSGYALAQDAGLSTNLDTGAGVSAGVSAGDTSVGADAGAGVDVSGGMSAGSGAADMGSVISDLSSGFNIDLSTVASAGDIQIISIDDLSGTADTTALDDAISANQTKVADLQTKLQGNATVTDELQTEGFSVDDVVAAESGADGKLVLYVQPAA